MSSTQHDGPTVRCFGGESLLFGFTIDFRPSEAVGSVGCPLRFISTVLVSLGETRTVASHFTHFISFSQVNGISLVFRTGSRDFPAYCVSNMISAFMLVHLHLRHGAIIRDEVGGLAAFFFPFLF